jgi:hypothetical protein
MVSPHGRSHSDVDLLSKFTKGDLNVDRILALSGIRGVVTVHARIAAFIDEVR